MSSVQRKGYTSDEELEELDSPLSSIIDKLPPSPSIIATENGNGKHKNHTYYTGSNARYELLREVWSSWRLTVTVCSLCISVYCVVSFSFTLFLHLHHKLSRSWYEEKTNNCKPEKANNRLNSKKFQTCKSYWFLCIVVWACIKHVSRRFHSRSFSSILP